jgi:hypothetical protein
MDENIFDVYAYNCYDYGDGQDGTLGFRGFLQWVFEANGKKKPMIITEFGFSVSDKGYGKYGGNTLVAQRDGVLKDYRDLIDAGAVGSCPFYYADGWWKGGDKNTHNNEPEEWFGFWGYSDVKDSIGSPRPVWAALKTYMKGLVISPKNQNVYTEKIPLELYTDNDVKKVVVKHDDKIIYQKELTKAGYFSDFINFEPVGIEDVELAFEFYSKNGELLKTESIYALISKNPVELPKLTINVTPADDLNQAKVSNMKITIENKGDFKIQDDVRASFCHHIGWDAGPSVNIPLKEQADKKLITFEQNYNIPDTCRVLTTSAGVTAKLGKFTLRLHDQKLIFRGDWAKEIGRR